MVSASPAPAAGCAVVLRTLVCALAVCLLAAWPPRASAFLHRPRDADSCDGTNAVGGAAEAAAGTAADGERHTKCIPWWQQSLRALDAVRLGKQQDFDWWADGTRREAEADGELRRRRRRAATQGTPSPASGSTFNAWSNGVITSSTLPGDLDDALRGDNTAQMYASMDVIQFQAAANGSLAECILLYMVTENGKVARTWLYQVKIAAWITLDDRLPDAAAAGIPTPVSPSFGSKRQWPSVAVVHLSDPPDDDFIDTVVIFGGATFSFDLFNDTWHLNDFNWYRIRTSEGHAGLGRMRHSATTQTVVNGSRSSALYYVYGGLRPGTTEPLVFLDDAWVLEIDDVAQIHMTGTWRRIGLQPGSPVPSGRAHAFVQLSSDGKLIMFGGWSLNLTNPAARNNLYRDLWELELGAPGGGGGVWRHKGDVGDRCALTTDNQSPSVTPPASYIPDLDLVVVYTMDCSDEPIYREQALLHVFDRQTQLWSLVKPKVAYDLVPYLSMHPAEVRQGTEITFMMRRTSQDNGEFVFIPFQVSFSQCSCAGPNQTQIQAATINSVVVQLGSSPSYLPDYSCIQAAHRTTNNTDVVYVVGGYQGNYTDKRINAQVLEVTRKQGMGVWLFHLEEDTWSKVQPSPAPPQRSGFSVVSDDQNLYMFAGYFITVPAVTIVPLVTMYADLWCFNFTSLEWIESQRPNAPEQASRQRLYHSAAMDTRRKRMLVFGGFDQNAEQIRGDMVLWTVLDGKKCVGQFHIERERPTVPKLVGHTATVIGDSMYVFGGITYGAPSSLTGKALHRSFYRVDLGTLTWTNLSATAPPGRVFHAATAVGNKLIITGGCSKENFNKWTEQAPYYYFVNLCYHGSEISIDAMLMYDTATALWTALPASNSPGKSFQHTTFVGHQAINILGGNLVTVNSESIQGAGLFRLTPSCAAGHYTSNFTTEPCLTCDSRTYSSTSGAAQCTPCRGKSMTGFEGATDVANCSQCLPGVCHAHGQCSVLDTVGSISCTCLFGFVSSDNCLIPIYYLLISFIVLLQVFLVIGVYTYRLYDRRRHAEHNKARQLRISRKEVSDLASAWEISSDEIVEKRRIDLDSPGGFGEVWLAEYRDMNVAVKKLHKHLHDAELRQEFEREVEILRRIRHPNIVLFLGTGMEKTGELPFIVLEYMQRGTLGSILAKQQINIDHIQRLRFAHDAARGMRFLHSLRPPRIHRDLKSANLLVSERWVVKVSDFGAARTIPNIGQALQQEKHSSGDVAGANTHVRVSWPATLSRNRHRAYSTLPRRTTEDDPLSKSWTHLSTEVGTFAWSSPELLQRKAYGSSTDVYSFGIVCWELYTRQEPFDEFTDCRMISDLVDAIVDNRRPTLPADCPPAYRSLVEECWHADQSCRPNFDDLVPRLDNLMESWATRDITQVQTIDYQGEVNPLRSVASSV